MCLDRHTDSLQMPVWSDATKTDVPPDHWPPQEWRWSSRAECHWLKVFSYREQCSTKGSSHQGSPPWVDIRMYIINVYISRFVWEILTHQEMVPRWISTKNIHAKDKPAQLCAHVPPPPLTASGISKWPPKATWWVTVGASPKLGSRATSLPGWGWGHRKGRVRSVWPLPWYSGKTLGAGSPGYWLPSAEDSMFFHGWWPHWCLQGKEESQRSECHVTQAF